MSAYKKQIGGSHYKSMVMQPSEFINKNRLPFAEGSAIKYICRHSAKGKEEDIKKSGLEEEARWRQRALNAEAEVDVLQAQLTTAQQDKLKVQEV